MTGSEGGGRRPGREHRSGPAAAALDCLALLVIVSLGLETIWGGNGLERLVLAIVFVTVVPGWALLAIRGPEDLVTRFAVAVGLSGVLDSPQLGHDVPLVLEPVGQLAQGSGGFSDFKLGLDRSLFGGIP